MIPQHSRSAVRSERMRNLTVDFRWAQCHSTWGLSWWACGPFSFVNFHGKWCIGVCHGIYKLCIGVVVWFGGSVLCCVVVLGWFSSSVFFLVCL